MVRAENIERKLSFLRATLLKLKRYQDMTLEQIRSNQDIQGAVERYLYLAAQASIDASEMYCKLKNFAKPESMAHSIEILQEHKVVGAALADKLMKMVGFRNRLAHGYEIIDYKVVEDVLRGHLDDLEEFAVALEKGMGLAAPVEH